MEGLSHRVGRRINQLEAEKRLLKYDLQMELMKLDENKKLFAKIQQEIGDLENRILHSERSLRQKEEQSKQHEGTRVGIEKSIEHELLAHSTLKQELDDMMTARKKKNEEENQETCRRSCQVHAALKEHGVEGGMSVDSTTDAGNCSTISTPQAPTQRRWHWQKHLPKLTKTYPRHTPTSTPKS
ncbi:hypothetical protein CSUI_009536 [Cystoisospora suis]|uniref:Uncharacterized protein n=1 Tax=Cystoisospora suis TaxID=483139 RepID=A0A2C6KJI7_9APIC|nr:hypothetical protein CSUI_009536 [Cystoisospora suis]